MDHLVRDTTSEPTSSMAPEAPYEDKETTSLKRDRCELQMPESEMPESEMPEYITDATKRAKRYNTYKKRMINMFNHLGHRTGCYGILYLRKLLLSMNLS